VTEREVTPGIGQDQAQGAVQPLGAEGGPSLLGEFRLLRPLGSGGMGEVYLAEQASLRRLVAVKLLRPDQTCDSRAIRRFELEAKAVAQLSHPNIVQVYSFGHQSGISYLAMEFVPGKNLREYVERHGPLSFPATVLVLAQAASALQHAAEQGIIHRDIKPDNILITRSGTVKITDFGLARLSHEPGLNLTQPGVALGTPLYMSPEQIQGQPLDHRSDLYSLGCTAYFMLTGRAPFTSDNPIAVAVQHLHSEPPSVRKVRSDVPEALERIIRRLLQKKPEDRYQNGWELLKDLQELPLGQSPTEPEFAPLSVTVPALVKTTRLGVPWHVGWLRGRRVRLLLPVLCLLAFVAGLALAWRAQQQRWASWAVRPTDRIPPESALEEVPHFDSPQELFDYGEALAGSAEAEAALWALLRRHPEATPWVRRAAARLVYLYGISGRQEAGRTLLEELRRWPNAQVRELADPLEGCLLAYAQKPAESMALLQRFIHQQSSQRLERELLDVLLHAFERNYRHLGRDSWDPELLNWAREQIRPSPRPRPGGLPGERKRASVSEASFQTTGR
jgi:hypothetical protein